MNKDTQENIPEVQLSLDEVGIKNYKTKVIVSRGNKNYQYILTVDVLINLSKMKKGAHLSRIIESINETLNFTKQEYFSLEQLAINILKALLRRHVFEKGVVKFTFDFFKKKMTPVSKKHTLEHYKGKLITFFKEKEYYHELSLGTYGNTVCPHAMNINKDRHTHIQRAYGEVTFKGRTTDIPDMEDICDVIDNSFSSPTYSLLKAEDESWVIDQMWKNPLFVEDVARNLLNNSQKMFSNKMLKINAEVRSYESIHKHDVISKGSVYTEAILKKKKD